MDTSKNDIAVIGIAGRFPEAADIREFYVNLKNGQDSIRHLSQDRIIKTTIQEGVEYTPLGYMENIDAFDNEFFKIAMSEAVMMDPRQRLLMEVVYESIENAGYNTDDFSGSDTALFVGDTALDYYHHIDAFDPTAVTGNMNAAMAGRIARFLNLRGEATMIDTACSSSLVAIYHACNQLLLGNATYALCCAGNLVLFPSEKNNDIQWDIISPDGKVKAFAADANGTVPGEAVVCVLLKPLDKALADKDIIHGVIKGVAVNQDGNLPASLTAPDSKAQAQVIQKAWKKAGIDPRSIGYIECHGTGTRLGDPIEIDGLNMAFRDYTADKHFCAVSSVKTNIGHTDSAAGIAGLVKVLLSLKYKVHFPSLHFHKPNPFIDFEDAAVYVNTVFGNWEKEGSQARRAGISSFGLIGTNCHAVLEEAPERDAAMETTVARPRLFTFSAASPASLSANIIALYDFLQNNTVPPGDLSYTLNAGRKHHRYRYSILSNSRDELLHQLSLAGIAGPTYTNTPQPDTIIFSFSHTVITRELLDRFCELHPYFYTYRAQCDACIAPSQQNELCHQFIFQYCFYHFLASKGIKNNLLLGDGTGKLVIAVLKNEIPLAQGMQKANEYQDTGSGAIDLVNRLKKMLDKENGKKHTLFVEMGPSGNISKALEEIKQGRDGLDVVSLVDDAGDCFWEYIRQLYHAGFPLQWQELYRGENVKRAELPSYQFNKKRCWVKDAWQAPVHEWMYTMQWTKSALERADPMTSGVFIVCKDSSGLSDHLIRKLEAAGNRCISVNWSSKPDYEALDKYLMENRINITGIIDLANYRSADPVNRINLRDQLDETIYRQLYLFKTFSKYFHHRNFCVLVVNANAQPVLPGEGVSMPMGAMCDGFLKAIIAEYPSLKVHSIDLAYGDGMDAGEKAENVLAELLSASGNAFTAYRNGERYIPHLVPLKTTVNESRITIRRGGVYLVTGGTGRIGMEVCKALAQQGPCHIVIIGRKVLPPQEIWKEYSKREDNGQAQLITDLLTVIANGTTIDYFAADVADWDAMTTVFSEIGKKFTAITGVIHAAGIGIKGTPVSDLDKHNFLECFPAKVQGTLILDELMQPFRPEFFLLFSSLNSLVPQKYSAGYTVANAFEDAFVHFTPGTAKYLTVNWPGWQPANDAGTLPATNRGELQLLSQTDGIRIFHRLFELEVKQVIVANVDWKLLASNPFFVVPGTGLQASLPAPVSPISGNTRDKVLSVWYEVLRAETILPDDDFFELGGHSLNGTQVINKLEKLFNIELDFDLIFEYGTVNTLAAYIDSLLTVDDLPAFEEIRPAPAAACYDLSHSQKRLWLFEQLQNRKDVYIIAGAFRLTGNIDIGIFQQVLEALVQRHESMRTVFMEVEAVPKQVIRSTVPFDEYFTYLNCSNREDEWQLNTQMERNRTLPFNLTTGPLFRITLLKTAENHILLFALHHIISDDWSLDVLMGEFSILYQAFTTCQPDPLPPLKMQFKDYVHWQNQQLSGNRLQEHRDFWVQQLAGYEPVLHFPVDFTRPAKPDFNGSTVQLALGTELTALLKKLSTDNHCTLFVTLLAVFKVLLYRVTGQHDLLIGTPVAGRRHDDLNNQVGFYINTLLVRTPVHKERSFADLLLQIKEYLARAYKYDAYPVDLILADQPANSIQTGFTWISGVYVNNGKKHQDDFQMELIKQNNTTAKYDLWLYGYESEEDIFLDMEYNTGLFVASTIHSLLQSMKELATGVTNNAALALENITFHAAAKQPPADFSLQQQFNFNF